MDYAGKAGDAEQLRTAWRVTAEEGIRRSNTDELCDLISVTLQLAGHCGWLGFCSAGHVSSQANELAARLKRFATRIVIFARSMPPDPAAQVIARQLTKSGTSEAANYHSARRARSRAEFIAKLGIAAEEADETEHWLEIIADTHIRSTTKALRELDWLLDESRQLRAILVASVRTARANHRGRSSRSQIVRSDP
jgi:four helix bundle protein